MRGLGMQGTQVWGCRKGGEEVGATDLGEGGRIWGVQGGGRWYRETGLGDEEMEAMNFE